MKKRIFQTQLPEIPQGLTVNVTMRFSFEELAAILSPEQMKALFKGVGEIVKATKNLGTTSGADRRTT